jgi:GT2 family glycosyltransferase
MISIITAVHNGLSFNRIFVDYLKKYTSLPFELIIIDNNSTDGTKEFFKQAGAIVIENKNNYSYPYCQNQGIKIAKGDYLFFLNNDIIVSPLWDERLISAATEHGLDVLSACGVENMGNYSLTQKMSNKWKRSKNLLIPFRFSQTNLRLMHRLMYGNWEKFCEGRYAQFKNQVVEGIVGNNVMMTKRAIDIVGLWDEQLQAADFDLFIRTKKRSIEVGDIKPCHIDLGVYIHHFIRMTSKYAVKPKPFIDNNNLIKLTDKWSLEEMDGLHPDNATIRRKK